MSWSNYSNHLSLGRYAQIMGIAPLHFFGATTSTPSPVVFPVDCGGIYPQYSWQNADQVSRDDVALAINVAERDIATIIGAPVAPQWFANEVYRWPRHYRPGVNGYSDVAGRVPAIMLKNKKVLYGGKRATTLVSAATVAGGEMVYTDADSDGFYETCTITVTTTVTDIRELQVYFTGKSANDRWRIAPLRSVSVSGGIATIVVDSWLVIDPDLQSAYPTADGWAAIEANSTGSFVTSLDVYRVYNNATDAYATLYWENPAIQVPCPSCGSTGCEVCSLASQNGCIIVMDPEGGRVRATPATYDADSAVWQQAAPTRGGSPSLVKLWYRAGDADEDWLSGTKHDPLPDSMAYLVAILATARLERPLCSCSGLERLSAELRNDMAMDRNAKLSYLEMSNPLGTRVGEMRVWNRLQTMFHSGVSVGAV